MTGAHHGHVPREIGIEIAVDVVDRGFDGLRFRDQVREIVVGAALRRAVGAQRFERLAHVVQVLDADVASPDEELELARELVALPREQAEARLQEAGLDVRAATNLRMYLDEQGEATGAIPDDRTIVVERFPDEIGDWRVCILTPFGSRVHAPWALAIEERLARLDLPVQVLWSDDGIILSLPEAMEDVPLDVLLVDPDEAEDLVVTRLPSTSHTR